MTQQMRTQKTSNDSNIRFKHRHIYIQVKVSIVNDKLSNSSEF